MDVNVETKRVSNKSDVNYEASDRQHRKHGQEKGGDLKKNAASGTIRRVKKVSPVSKINQICKRSK